MLCLWWDQKGVVLVYHELLKPGETLNTNRYRKQMINFNHALIEKRPEWARRHGKVILLHDNAPAHKAKSVQDTMKVFGWELPPLHTVGARLGTFRLPFVFIDGTRIGCVALRFLRRSWKLSIWLVCFKGRTFLLAVIHKLPERWSKCVKAMVNTLNNFFYFPIQN